MPVRGRFLSRKRSVDPKFNSLTDSEALLYDMLVSWLDAEGRYYGDPIIIKGNVCPMRDWTVGQVEQMLNQIESIKRDDGLGLLNRYTAGGIKCLFMAGFIGEQIGLQKTHEAKGKYGYSEIPPPPQRLLSMLGKQIKSRKQPSPTASSKHPIDETLIANERLAGMVEYYRETLGRDVMPMDFENMKTILDEFGDEAFKRAVDAAKQADARNPMRYIDTCLVEWAKKGEIGEPEIIPEAEEAFND